jgi:hypothetical protein
MLKRTQEAQQCLGFLQSSPLLRDPHAKLLLLRLVPASVMRTQKPQMLSATEFGWL